MVPPAVLGLNVAVLAPASVYFANQGEFLLPFSDSIGQMLLGAFLLIWAMFSLLSRLPGRWGTTIRLLVLFLVFVSYLHGNLLIWVTGLLDGSALELAGPEKGFGGALSWIALGLLG